LHAALAEQTDFPHFRFRFQRYMLNKATQKGSTVADDIGAMVHQTLLGEAWEHASVAVAIFSDDARYLACNQAFCRLTGYSREEIARMRVGVDLAPEPETNTKLFQAIVRDTKSVGSGGLKRKDGSVTTVNVWAIDTRAANLPYYIVLYWPSAARPKRADVGG
jgi:PAS domain S-box-containing protein